MYTQIYIYMFVYEFLHNIYQVYEHIEKMSVQILRSYMQANKYEYIYIRIYVHIYIHPIVCIYIYIHTYLFIYAYVYVYMLHTKKHRKDVASITAHTPQDL